MHVGTVRIVRPIRTLQNQNQNWTTQNQSQTPYAKIHLYPPVVSIPTLLPLRTQKSPACLLLNCQSPMTYTGKEKDLDPEALEAWLDMMEDYLTLTKTTDAT